MLEIQSFYQENLPLRLKVVEVVSLPFNIFPGFGLPGFPIAPEKQRLLSQREQEIVRLTSARADHMFILLRKHCDLSPRELTVIRMSILTWVNTLDDSPKERRLLVEALPLLYLDETVLIKFEDTDGEFVMSGGRGQVMRGTLRSWEVWDGSGTCTVEAEGSGRKVGFQFRVEDLLEDSALIEFIRQPKWSRGMLPKKLAPKSGS